MFLFDVFGMGCNTAALGNGTVGGATPFVAGWNNYGVKRIVIVLGDYDIYGGTQELVIAENYAILVQSAQQTGLSVVVATMPLVPFSDNYSSSVQALNSNINEKLDEAAGVYVWPLGATIESDRFYTTGQGYNSLTSDGCAAMMDSYATINQ